MILENIAWSKAKDVRVVRCCFVPSAVPHRWMGYCTVSEMHVHDDGYVQELLNPSNSINTEHMIMQYQHASLACSIDHQSFLPILACIPVTGGETQGILCRSSVEPGDTL
jgi:hypothetical protein